MATKKKKLVSKKAAPAQKKLTQHQWDLVLDARQALDEECEHLRDHADNVAQDVTDVLAKVVAKRKIGKKDVLEGYRRTIDMNLSALQKALSDLEEGVSELDLLLDEGPR